MPIQVDRCEFVPASCQSLHCPVGLAECPKRGPKDVSWSSSVGCHSTHYNRPSEWPFPSHVNISHCWDSSGDFPAEVRKEQNKKTKHWEAASHPFPGSITNKQTDLCEDPLLVWWRSWLPFFQRTYLHPHRPRIRLHLETQLLGDVMTQLLFGRILKILQTITDTASISQLARVVASEKYSTVKSHEKQKSQTKVGIIQGSW